MGQCCLSNTNKQMCFMLIKTIKNGRKPPKKSLFVIFIYSMKSGHTGKT